MLVRLAVDGEPIDTVTLDARGSQDLLALDLMIARLMQVRNHLAAITPGHLRVAGRCMHFGDWGRCNSLTDQDGEHDLPTESLWRRLKGIPATAVSGGDGDR